VYWNITVDYVVSIIFGVLICVIIFYLYHFRTFKCSFPPFKESKVIFLYLLFILNVLLTWLLNSHILMVTGIFCWRFSSGLRRYGGGGEGGRG